MGFREFDLENWNRKSLFDYFRGYDDPFFNVTSEIDVGSLTGFCKKQNIPYSLANLFFALQAANEILEFRLRIFEGRLVEFDRIGATQTLLHDDGSFSFCPFEMKDSLEAFLEAGSLAVEDTHRGPTLAEEPRLDLIYCSVIPWISFSSFKHAKKLVKDDAIPRMVFGKYYERSGRKVMPVSLEVNHAMMDGIHVAEFYKKFQEKISELA